MTASCFYDGTVRHRRDDPEVAFCHALELAYVDLDELPGLLGGRLLRRGIGPLRFRRRDYLGAGGASSDLAASVRAAVADATGRAAPAGPVRLLTQLRSFGVCFNPVSFYYCFAGDGAQVEAMIAEVTNTPWGERHAYVVAAQAPAAGTLSGRFAKALHVSPFMDMDREYECQATVPGDTLSVHIESRPERAGAPGFGATLDLRRRPMNRRTAVRHAARFPADSARVLALIYGRALRLKLAGARHFPRPAARVS